MAEQSVRVLSIVICVLPERRLRVTIKSEWIVKISVNVKQETDAECQYSHGEGRWRRSEREVERESEGWRKSRTYRVEGLTQMKIVYKIVEPFLQPRQCSIHHTQVPSLEPIAVYTKCSIKTNIQKDFYILQEYWATTTTNWPNSSKCFYLFDFLKLY